MKKKKKSAAAENSSRAAFSIVIEIYLDINLRNRYIAPPGDKSVLTTRLIPAAS